MAAQAAAWRNADCSTILEGGSALEAKTFTRIGQAGGVAGIAVGLASGNGIHGPVGLVSCRIPIRDGEDP